MASLKIYTFIKKFINKQECIPVGCVPSAAVAVCPGGVPGPRGKTGPGGGGISACTEADPPVDRQTGVKT